MAYYNYYQNQLPQWGQQAYASQAQNLAFVAPPMPTYQPQPDWNGHDYYAAHYGLGNRGDKYDSDLTLFDTVWSQLKHLVGAAGVNGRVAREWHRKVYGGFVDITTLLPDNLGAAAGYEVFRVFRTHNSIYALPMAGDRERQEEALAGMAVAEATRLWSYCGRPSDKYGRKECSEVAAATAERLYRRARRRDREYQEGHNYNSDSDSYDSGSNRRRRRQGSNSSYRRRGSINYGAAGVGAYGTGVVPAVQQQYIPSYGSVPMPIAGAQYGANLGMGGINYTHVGSPGSPVSPVSQYLASPQLSNAGLSYGGSSYGVPTAGYTQSPGGFLGVPGQQMGGVRPRSVSFGGYSPAQGSPQYY